MLSIEQLEENVWANPEFSSCVICTSHVTRKNHYHSLPLRKYGCLLVVLLRLQSNDQKDNPKELCILQSIAKENEDNISLIDKIPSTAEE